MSGSESGSGSGVRNTILVSLLSQGLRRGDGRGDSGGQPRVRPYSALAVILHFGFVNLYLKCTLTPQHHTYLPAYSYCPIRLTQHNTLTSTSTLHDLLTHNIQIRSYTIHIESNQRYTNPFHLIIKNPNCIIFTFPSILRWQFAL